HASRDSCRFEGTTYSHGSTACQSGTQFRCDDGDWKTLGVACPAGNPSTCTYNGTAYSLGSSSCQSGTEYRCDGGKWTSLALARPPEPVAPPRVVPAPLKPCRMEGSPVSHASTVCRSGVMFMCDDGDWKNLGTACR